MEINSKSKTTERMNQLVALMADWISSGDIESEHLDDDDYVSYTIEESSGSDMERIDRHLVICAACTEEMENLIEGSQAWRTDSGKRAFAAKEENLRINIIEPLRKGMEIPQKPEVQTISFKRELEKLLGSFSYEHGVALQFSTDDAEYKVSDEGGFSYSIDDREEVKITLSCLDAPKAGTELESLVGTLIELYAIAQDGSDVTIAEDWARDKWQAVSDEELSLQLVIPYEYRNKYRKFLLRLSVV